MRRTLTIFGCQLLLWLLVTQLNDTLAGLHIHLFAGALYLTFASLTQSFGIGLRVAVLIGLVCDANTPVAFGTHMLLFATTHVFVCRLQDRVARDDTVGRVLVTILANLGVFLVFSFTEMIRLPGAASLWPPIVGDLVCSQLFLVIATPWFFALQTRALQLVGADRHSYI
jgi:cell shape-determining protein MreD